MSSDPEAEGRRNGIDARPEGEWVGAEESEATKWRKSTSKRREGDWRASEVKERRYQARRWRRGGGGAAAERRSGGAANAFLEKCTVVCSHKVRSLILKGLEGGRGSCRAGHSCRCQAMLWPIPSDTKIYSTDMRSNTKANDHIQCCVRRHPSLRPMRGGT